MTADKFQIIQDILKGFDNPVIKYGITAIINFQFHMIARIDDTTQAQLENIRVHNSFPFTLKTRLNWSKNVNEERDACTLVIRYWEHESNVKVVSNDEYKVCRILFRSARLVGSVEIQNFFWLIVVVITTKGLNVLKGRGVRVLRRC